MHGGNYGPYIQKQSWSFSCLFALSIYDPLLLPGIKGLRDFFSTNPMLGIQCLHNLQGQLLGFHYRILGIKLSSESLYFISVGIKFQIICPKYRSELDPLYTVSTSGITKSDCEHKL